MKYFNEPPLNSHYDIRFFKSTLNSVNTRVVLINLLNGFVNMCDTHGIKPVLMHGGLIGWHWNKSLLPWDNDLDFSILLTELDILNDLYENLIYDKSLYLFDINKYYKNRESANKKFSENKELNRIDARFIDKNSGLFIDITAFSPLRENMLQTKCPHFYLFDDIYPLKSNTFEKINIYLPNNYKNVLIQEYGLKSIWDTQYESYNFDSSIQKWVKIKTRETIWRYCMVKLQKIKAYFKRK